MNGTCGSHLEKERCREGKERGRDAWEEWKQRFGLGKKASGEASSVSLEDQNKRRTAKDACVSGLNQRTQPVSPIPPPKKCGVR